MRKTSKLVFIPLLPLKTISLITSENKTLDIYLISVDTVAQLLFGSLSNNYILSGQIHASTLIIYQSGDYLLSSSPINK